MSETNPNVNPEQQQTETEPETSGQRHLADDVTNQPTGEVEQAGPVTHNADHVPEDAPKMFGTVTEAPQTKVVKAPETEAPEASSADVETA